MKTKTQYERLIKSPEFRRLYAIEGLVTEAGELIARLMQKQRVTKAELARRLGKSRAYITQMLSGSKNLTLRTLAEVVYALGAEVKLEATPLQAAEREPARADSVGPIWKVIEIPTPASRSEPELPLSGPGFKPGDHTSLQYHYVA